VNPLLAVVALAVVGGAVAAVSIRDVRAAILGASAVAVASPLLADPLPAPIGLAARLLAAILAGYLLWIAGRDGGIGRSATAPLTGGSRIGWPAEILVAAAGAVVGWSAHGLGASAPGPMLASAAGFAVAALAVTPLLTGRDVMRLGVGLILLLHAGLLVLVALGGTPPVLEELVTAGLVAALGGAIAALAMAARSDGDGSLELTVEIGGRRQRPPDAHPIDEAAGGQPAPVRS
jgi:hypothetical protein